MARWLQTASWLCFGIAIVSLLLSLGLDSRYLGNPQSPSASHIFPHDIKGTGTVYLTESEEEPYRWLLWIVHTINELRGIMAQTPQANRLEGSHMNSEARLE
jgi:hypothetical protein